MSVLKKVFVSAFLIFSLFTIFNTTPAYADAVKTCDGVACISNPLSAETPQALIGQIINSILGVVGSLALLMFVYGGITWMTSSGNQEKVKKGRDIIVWAAIGLVIVFSAYGLTRVLIEGIS